MVCFLIAVDDVDVLTGANCSLAASQSATDVSDDDLDRFFSNNMDSFLHLLPYECLLCETVLRNEDELKDHMNLHCLESL